MRNEKNTSDGRAAVVGARKRSYEEKRKRVLKKKDKRSASDGKRAKGVIREETNVW
jgi:hypothetical protein